MRELRRLATVLALMLPVSPTSVSAQTPAFTDSTALDAATREVASQLRCVVCQGLSIEDSPSELAQSMRAVVRDQLAEGRTPEEIKDYFVASYGEWVLLQPRATGFNLTVYALPVAMVLAGAGFVFVLARRWSRPDEPVDTVPAEDPDLAAWDDLVPRN